MAMSYDVLLSARKRKNMKSTLLCVTSILWVALAHNHLPDGTMVVNDPQNVVAASSGTPWPMPKSISEFGTMMTIDPTNFKMVVNMKDCDIMNRAVQRYMKLTFLEKCLPIDSSRNSLFNSKKKSGKDKMIKKNGMLYNISITVLGKCEKWPYLNMDEQYLLKIDSPDLPGKANLVSSTVWGALRGLETFSQIVYSLGGGKFAVNSTMILDSPRFSHRGLLLDTSRHFVPVSVLKQNLDAMAYSKLNVFHWHIVDDQSFPYESFKFPNLSRMGAFIPKTHTYSQEIVADIINYARDRGIRVMAEFDTPGHTQSWGKGQPGLLTPCYSEGKPNGNFGPINPILQSSYDFLTEFFGEITKVFPDNYVHLGGDEVDFSCWKSNPNITDFMKKHAFGSDYSKLEGYYEQKLVNILQSLKKSYTIWQEVLDNGVKVDPNTVVHVWKDPQVQELQKVTSMGYKTLLSTCWYLNYISYGKDWPKYYTCDPQEFNGTEYQKSLIMGGEVCMWGEFVDGTNLISRTWPRAAAVAERLWSVADLKDVNKATPRFEEHRCRMLKRGLRVQPGNGPSFCECDFAVL
ncbi:beta-hexosaminidase subunit alpha-like isoform X2 [Tachypleus tridentatus]|uniref:beta-hexosaminidase subunit alpha-like isoform X2 n=1 Tax=Tachypleus tridentatus TaxID=6853 RepID=UPI003FD2149C